MKLMTCFLVVRVFKTNVLYDFFAEAKELIIKNGGEKKDLPSSEKALITTDPYTEKEYKEEPSFRVNNCLVSVRLWYNIFDGPAVSIIIVGKPDDIIFLKDMFQPLCQASYLKGRTYDDREKFDISENTFDVPDNFNWQDSYFYAEFLAKDLREGNIERKSSGPSLWDSVKDITFLGERLSGEPEILHEIEDRMRKENSLANRAQIQKVLESVPDVFSESWRGFERYDDLSDSQKRVYEQISDLGFELSESEIGRVIELALGFKNQRTQ